MECQRPAAGLGIKARQNARSERMLRAGTGVDGHPRRHQLRIIADEILRHCRRADHDIADSEHGGAPEKIRQKAVDHLQPLADETGESRKKSQSDQTEAELGHHDGKYDGGDAVLQMVQNVAAADQAQGHSLLPQACFERRRRDRRNQGGVYGSGWITHRTVSRKRSFFCTKTYRRLSNPTGDAALLAVKPVHSRRQSAL